MRRRLRELDVRPDHRLKESVPEDTPDLVEDLVGQLGTPVDLARDDARELDLRIQPPLNEADDLGELRHPLQREELGL